MGNAMPVCKRTPSGKLSFVLDNHSRLQLFTEIEAFIVNANNKRINSLTSLKDQLLINIVFDFRNRQNWAPAINGRKRFSVKRSEALALVAVLARCEENISLLNLKSEILKCL